MSKSDDDRRGICILSLDSGGPGTYSQLLILKEYMSRLANDLNVAEEDVYPADYFDLIGGLLKMNVDEAIDALITLASTTFVEDETTPEANSKKLRKAIEDLLRTRNVPLDTKMLEQNRPQTGCKVTLYAATSVYIGRPHAFRTYSIRGSSPNPTIVEAVCATMAAPPHFVPVKITGPQMRERSFIGPPLGANNPTSVLLNEANAIFGENTCAAQIISIGSGLSRVIFTESLTDRLLMDIGTDCEMVAQELSLRLFTIDVYIRLNVDRGMEAVTMTDWGGLANIESYTAAYTGTTAVTQVLEDSLMRLRGRIGVVTLGQLTLSNDIWVMPRSVPAVSPYFVLRHKEWERLVWHLVTSPSKGQRILPITGMGGCGKTQLVSYFLQEYPSLFKHIVFVDASTLFNIKTDLQIWARSFGNGHERDLWDDAFRVLSSIPEGERWALILDNADDPILNIVPFIPKNASLTVVITSRNRDLGNLSTTHHMELGEMELDEALATLLSAARRQLPLSTEEVTSAHTLLNELGCLALALVQAGAYCHKMACSFTEYLSLLYSYTSKLTGMAEESSLESSALRVYAALDRSYRALSPDVQNFLHFISFFHYTDIPLGALATASASNFADPLRYLPRPEDHSRTVGDLNRLLCSNGSWSELDINKTISTLQSFSLISIASEGDMTSLRLHPLIQAWSRDMDSSSSQHYRAMALQVLTTCCQNTARPLHHRLPPHILDVTDQLRDQNLHINDLMALGKNLRLQSRYRAAAGLFEQALEILENTIGPNEEDVTTVSLWLTSIYKDDRRWDEAAKLQAEVMERQRGLLGMGHPKTTSVAMDLVETFRRLKRWIEVERLQVVLFEEQKRNLGIEDPDTINAASNLASTYHVQGRLGDAEKLELEVMEQRRRTLGMRHSDTISAAANLAATYRKQNRWRECAATLAPAVELSLKVLGKPHPETQLRLRNLVEVYENLGKEKQAQDARDLLIP